MSLIASQSDALNRVTEACYIHTDTWDGNIMVINNQFTGLVDFAAVLYGDPLMNHDFHDFSPEHLKAFLDGYGKSTGSFTQDEKIRILIYKIWQRLGMIVERGFRNYEDSGLYAWVLDEFTKEIDCLLALTAVN